MACHAACACHAGGGAQVAPSEGDGTLSRNTPSLKALEQALANDQLRLHYQPKVCLLRGEIVGAEALVRWEDPEQEVLAPDVFLPLAVESGLLHDITMQLLDQAVAACLRIRDVRADLALSMNVAPDDLESQTISNRIGTLLAEGTISPEELQIEITESAVMGNMERVHDDLQRLNTLGIKILMDDFGTGWSSIDRLSQLPFSSLKLDQGVVRRMGTSRQNLDTVRAAISMARELRMTSVAEGVESDGAYNFLIASGCEEAQGYFIGRPMSLDDFLGFAASPPVLAGSQIGRVHQSVFNLIHLRKNVLDAAICCRLGFDTVLPSVIESEGSDDVARSRVGLWYWGVGQRLAHIGAFRAFDSPYRALHASTRTCVALMAEGVTDTRLDAAVTDMDELTDRAIRLLHDLERELLRARTDTAAHAR